MKINQITKKRLYRYRLSDIEAGRWLYELVQKIENGESLKEDYPDRLWDVDYTIHGNTIITQVDCEYSRKHLRGLSTLYPHNVETTFTHGNNQVLIRDINALVRKMDVYA